MVRTLACTACGVRFESTEQITYRFKAKCPVTATNGTNGCIPPPIRATAHPSRLIADGGVGGGLPSVSDPVRIPDGSGSFGASGSVSEGDQGSDRAREKVIYPAAFEAFWVSTWGHGGKGAALKAWKAHGKPSAEQAAPAIKAYVDAKRTSGQTLQHVSVWLNADGHLQTEWRLSSVNRPIVDSRPQWQRDREATAERERAASQRYYERESERKSLCGFHLYNGEDKRFVLDECTARCPRHGEDRQEAAHA